MVGPAAGIGLHGLEDVGVLHPAASAVQVLLQLLYFRTGRWNHSVLGEAQT